MSDHKYHCLTCCNLKSVFMIALQGLIPCLITCSDMPSLSFPLKFYLSTASSTVVKVFPHSSSFSCMITLFIHSILYQEPIFVPDPVISLAVEPKNKVSRTPLNYNTCWSALLHVKWSKHSSKEQSTELVLLWLLEALYQSDRHTRAGILLV